MDVWQRFKWLEWKKLAVCGLKDKCSNRLLQKNISLTHLSDANRDNNDWLIFLISPVKRILEYNSMQPR